jgi:hypothetical protein
MSQVNFSLSSAVAQSIGSTTDLISNVVNSFIVSPSSAPPGINGFVFDSIGPEEIHLQSDITDSYLETNYAIQDHVALKPVKFTLTGYVGELTDIFQVEAENLLTPVIQLLSPGALIPNWNAQDGQAYAALAQANNIAQTVINNITSVASLIGQLLPTLTKQEQAYSIFYKFWSTRTLCTIQTPFGLLTSMMIEDVRPVQSEKTTLYSEFQVTFKQINTVSTSVTSTVGNPNPAGSATQTSPQATAQALTVQSPVTQNFPNQIQSGITDGEASGPMVNALTPVPNLPGASSTGVPLEPNTNIPIDVEKQVIPNPVISGTLPVAVKTPQINLIAPQVPFQQMEISPFVNNNML